MDNNLLNLDGTAILSWLCSSVGSGVGLQRWFDVEWHIILSPRVIKNIWANSPPPVYNALIWILLMFRCNLDDPSKSTLNISARYQPHPQLDVWTKLDSYSITSCAGVCGSLIFFKSFPKRMSLPWFRWPVTLIDPRSLCSSDSRLRFDSYY